LRISRSISLLELLALPLVFAQVFLSREFLFIAYRPETGHYLETGLSLSLLAPFLLVPFLCILAFLRFSSGLRLSARKFVLILVVGILVGGFVGLLVSVPAYWNHLEGYSDYFHRNPIYANVVERTHIPEPSRRLKRAAFFFIPMKYSFVGLVSMSFLIAYRLRLQRNRH